MCDPHAKPIGKACRTEIKTEITCVCASANPPTAPDLHNLELGDGQREVEWEHKACARLRAACDLAPIRAHRAREEGPSYWHIPERRDLASAHNR
jgi:hypothetical protein